MASMGDPGTGGPPHPLAWHAMVDRRQAIRAAVLAAGASAVAACAGGSRQSAPTTVTTGDGDVTVTTRAMGTASTTATTTATTAPSPATVNYDPARPYWEQGGFRPVSTEVEGFLLPVTGALPPSLTGLYVRNGSNPRGASAHWFLGDGMVHGVRLEAGRAAWYRNRWVRTPLLGRGDILGGGDVGAPGGAVNSSNTSVVHASGRLLSLQEVGFPYELSPRDLSTVGPFDFGGSLTTSFTAHPKRDPATGLLHSFGYGFTPPYLTYHVSTPDGQMVLSEEVAVGAATMIHDFAVTDRDVIFWEFPVVFDIQLAMAGEMPFTWQPDYGARVGVMPLGGPTSAIRWVDVPAQYVFHGTNARRDGDDVVIDVSVLGSMFRAGGDEGALGVHRWRIGTGGTQLTFRSEVVTDRRIDLPTIDPRVVGRPHRHAWYVPTRDELGGFEFGGVVRLDARTGATQEWDPGPERAGGEPLFVPDGTDEGEGWVLVFVYDKTRDASDLVVLDATDVAAGPVASVALPQRVPFGFHGCWLADG